MPIYEYLCGKCAHEFEQMTRMDERDRQRVCPECGAAEVERKFSVFAARQGEGRSTVSSAAVSSPPGGCGRCGGPGPCGFE